MVTADDQNRLVGSDRVLGVLLALGDRPSGASLDELAAAMGSPKPTVHRALTSLRRAGLAAQLSRGMYTLGDEFFRIAFHNHAERPEAAIVGPVLDALTERFGETVHYAVLDGTEVVYRAKKDPSRGAVRLSSVIGGRNPAYSTAVGKLLLSNIADDRDHLRTLVGDTPPRTDRTRTTIDALWEDLQRIRRRGYATDDEENELGVNCVAVPFQTGPAGPAGAISVSALAFRLPLAELEASAPEILRMAEAASRA